MIELTVVACVAVVALVVLLVAQAREAKAERAEWRQERRFLIDRAIAQHIGEVVALEREDSRKSGDVSNVDATVERHLRPLIEGLS